MEQKDALDLKTKVLNEWKEELISISEELWNRMEEEPQLGLDIADALLEGQQTEFYVQLVKYKDFNYELLDRIVGCIKSNMEYESNKFQPSYEIGTATYDGKKYRIKENIIDALLKSKSVNLSLIGEFARDRSYRKVVFDKDDTRINDGRSFKKGRYQEESRYYIQNKVLDWLLKLNQSQSPYDILIASFLIQNYENYYGTPPRHDIFKWLLDPKKVPNPNEKLIRLLSLHSYYLKELAQFLNAQDLNNPANRSYQRLAEAIAVDNDETSDDCTRELWQEYKQSREENRLDFDLMVKLIIRLVREPEKNKYIARNFAKDIAAGEYPDQDELLEIIAAIFMYADLEYRKKISEWVKNQPDINSYYLEFMRCDLDPDIRKLARDEQKRLNNSKVKNESMSLKSKKAPIFISYAEDDLKEERFSFGKIIDYMKRIPSIGYIYFFRNLKSGSINKYMEDGISNSKIVVFFFGPNSLKSEGQRIEFDLAKRLGKIILPIFYDKRDTFKDDENPIGVQLGTQKDFNDNMKKLLDILTENLK